MNKKITNYVHAITSAARTNPAHLLPAAYSVLLARIRYGFGPKLYSLFDFYSRPPSEWADYLQDRHLKPQLRTIQSAQHRQLTHDKIAFHDHCVSNDIATIPIVARLLRSDEASAGSSAKKHLLEEQRTRFIEELNAGPNALFFKTVNGTHGADAFVATRVGAQWKFGDTTGTAADLYEYCLATRDDKTGWIAQPRIAPHPALQKIMARDSLGTLRAITYINGTTPTVAFAVLRIPAGKNITDNFSHGRTGNLVAPVDLANGNIGTARYSLSPNWPTVATIDHHPETGNRITGETIPYWNETIELLIRGQVATPRPPTLGWDIAITESGPLVVEANSTYDIDIVQFALNRGIRVEMERILMLSTHFDS